MACLSTLRVAFLRYSVWSTLTAAYSSMRLLRLTVFLPDSRQVSIPYPPLEAGARCMRLSGVKVPRPASPFITHETTLGVEMAVAVSRGRVKDVFKGSFMC
jgi:hypothetical protein